MMHGQPGIKLTFRGYRCHSIVCTMPSRGSVVELHKNRLHSHDFYLVDFKLCPGYEFISFILTTMCV
jgi:hypothetical protein